MPNWLYLFFHFLFTAGLAIWIGGAIVLGVFVAPALFRSLPREQAGSIFGPVLRRFARLRLVAAVLIVTGSIAKYVLWETHAASPWIAIRWAAIVFLVAAVVYEVLSLYPAIEGRGADFEQLHKRSEMLMKASVAAALVALFFS